MNFAPPAFRRGGSGYAGMRSESTWSAKTDAKPKEAKLSVRERLQARLTEQLGWEVALPERTYAGKRQLEAFCMSWSARDVMKDEVCSIYTMSECLKAARLEVKWQRHWWEVVPIND